jgi:hypothetical protein
VRAPHLESDAFAARRCLDLERVARKHEPPKSDEGDGADVASSGFGGESARDEHQLRDSGEDRTAREVSFEQRAVRGDFDPNDHAFDATIAAATNVG